MLDSNVIFWFIGDRFLLFVVATSIETRQNNRDSDASAGQCAQVVSEFPVYILQILRIKRQLYRFSTMYTLLYQLKLL